MIERSLEIASGPALEIEGAIGPLESVKVAIPDILASAANLELAFLEAEVTLSVQDVCSAEACQPHARVRAVRAQSHMAVLGGVVSCEGLPGCALRQGGDGGPGNDDRSPLVPNPTLPALTASAES